MNKLLHVGFIAAGLSIAALIGCEGFPPLPPQPPIVDPKPVTGAATVYVVEESANRTPAIAKLRNDSWWRSGSVELRWYDRDAEGIESLLEKIGDTALPAIVIVDKDGNVLHVGELPATIDGVKKLVGK